MKISSILILLLLLFRCSEYPIHFIPDDFQYPESKIGMGKTFVYKNSATDELTFDDLKILDIDGHHFQTLKSYDSKSVHDSVKLLNGKVFETFNFFMNKGGDPIKAENLKDTILNNGLKLGIHLTERKYEAEELRYLINSQEQFLKDTTVVWENAELPCLVIQVHAEIRIEAKTDTSINHSIEQTSECYYAKGIGIIKYTSQFIDHDRKDNYDVWELKSIEDIKN